MRRRRALETRPDGESTSQRPRRRPIPPLAKNSASPPSPRYLFGAWNEITERIRNAKILALLLDFDGTLVRLQRRPMDVRVSARTKQLLERLSRHPLLFVAIVSGRRRDDLQTRIGIETLHYVGLHGAEAEGTNTKISKSAGKILALAKRRAQGQIATMPGMRIEDKGLSFAVHYRSAAAPVARAAKSSLLKLVAPLQHSLKMFEGAMVWEVLPNEIPGKGAAARVLLTELPKGTPAIYIGDDGTDESAFRALRDQITIRVGKARKSDAKYYLRNTSEVIHFLLRLEADVLQARPVST
jgi:trehalose 6-phosphate phosphatase